MMSHSRHESTKQELPRERRLLRRAPAWITEELIADTISTWQPYYDEPLTEQDAIEVLVNVGRLFDLLEADHARPREEAPPEATE